MKVGRPKQKDTEVLYLRLPKEIARQVRDEAKSEHRGIAATIERIIERHYAVDSVSAD
jgi:hypothetical protein